jgi:tricorn protease
LLILVAFAASARADEAAPGYVMRYADISGDQIVFTYEDDLWLVPVAGGDAHRITSHPGREIAAKFSPDGAMLAFTGNYDGGRDVYVMDAQGGVPRRLTFHPSGGVLLDWTSDGKSVIFTSSREAPAYAPELYTISIEGGMPVKLPVDRGSLASMAPDGSAMAFNRLGRHVRTWKRYEGGLAQDVWIVDFASGDITKITDWSGSDQFPMWGDDGAVYFNSDREDATLNLYRYDAGTGATARLTQFADYDVKWPSYGDGKIVFQYGPGLSVYDVATARMDPITITIPSDRRYLREDLEEPAPRTGAFGLSPGGERALIAARGEILNLPTDKGDALDLTHSSSSREKNAVWSPDGRWIALVSDRSGEEQIYLVDQHGKDAWKQVTDGTFGFMNQPVWSPDSKSLIFSDKYMKLHLVDVGSGKTTGIAQSDYDDAWERWGIMDYVWSPDSRWIAYTRQTANMNEAIWLHDTKTNENHQLTDDMSEDWSPSFSSDGKYLYFLSNRTFNPIMGRQDQNHVFLKLARPYLFLLHDDERSPFHDEDVAVNADDDEEEGADDEEKKDDEPIETRIDLDGISARQVACEGVEAGNYFRLESIEGGFLFLEKKEPEFLKYQNVDDGTGGSLDLLKYALEDREAEPILEGIANFHLSADRESLIYRAGGRYGMVDADEGGEVGDGELDLGAVKLHVNRMDEYPQIFAEAWRIQRDWFYDENMHGTDWQAMYDKYAPFVAGCGTRGDLNYLIGEMISELNIGHTYVFGGDFEDGAERVRTGAPGAEFTATTDAAYYRIGAILPGVTWDPRYRSPLADPGVPVNVGDYLIAIDGEEVVVDNNIYAHLVDKGDRMVTVTTNSEPTAEGAIDTRVKTLRSERNLRYRDWVDRNLAHVDERSDGRLGYIHLPNMSQSGLVEFGRSWYPQTGKQAMIIDDRYNGGGFVGDMIIDRLERELWAFTQPREGGVGRNPERCFHGPLVVLINAETYSNGEFFAEAVKRLGIATTIGERTWGGSTGIEPHQDLVDGGGTTPPQFGLFGLDGSWPIEGWGVVPEIIVVNAPADAVAGKDDQLDHAIDYLLQQLADSNGKWELPAVPDHPNKAKPKMSGLRSE